MFYGMVHIFHQTFEREVHLYIEVSLGSRPPPPLLAHLTLEGHRAVVEPPERALLSHCLAPPLAPDALDDAPDTADGRSTSDHCRNRCLCRGRLPA